jgi:predicted component of type VI protein secretion system
MTEEELALQQKARIGRVLSELRNSPAWQEFCNIFIEMYEDESEKLNAMENNDARAMKNAIRNIAERFDIKIKEGKVSEEILKQMLGTS